MKYVLSTMTTSVSYAVYTHAGDLPVIRDKVTIKGGANLPNAKSGFGELGEDGEGMPIWTPAGVVTPIPDEKMELLLNHALFKKHLDKGFVKVLDHDISGNHKAVQKAVRDMEQRDGYAQLTPETIKNYAKVRRISVNSIDSELTQ